MAEVVFGFLTERVREVVFKLKAKLFDEVHAPQTIVGKDYLRVNVHNVDVQHQTRCAPLIKKVDDFNLNKLDLNISSIVAYGPFYHHLEQPNTWKTAKDEAWNHVLKSTTDDEGDEIKTTLLFFEALRRVENEARAQYGMDNSSIANLSSDDFVMIDDDT